MLDGEYYTGSYSQEPRYTNKIIKQSNNNDLLNILYNECIIPQFNFKNLGIDYLSDIDNRIAIILYDKIISFIDESYIHIDMSFKENDLQLLMYGKALYETFFIDIPINDINEFKDYYSKNNNELRNYLINYYATRAKRYDSLKSTSNSFAYQIFKNSMLSILFDNELENFKSKYLNTILNNL